MAILNAKCGLVCAWYLIHWKVSNVWTVGEFLVGLRFFGG